MLGLTSDIKVKVVSENGCLHTLAVEWPASKVKEKIEEAFKIVQNQAKLPGFRPGKAPIQLVRENFKGVAYERAQDLMMRDGVAEALKSKKINPVQTPLVQTADFVPEKSFNFQFQVEVAPQVKLSSYKGLKLNRKNKVIGEADISKSLTNLGEMNARLVESKEESLKNNHFAVVNYEGFIDGKTIEGAKADNFLLDMSAPQGIVGLAEGLVGAKTGEEREIKVKFPEDSPSKDLAGKEAIFKVKLNAIKEKTVPALDDEFAKDLGLESLQKLKDRIRENLEAEQKRATADDLEKQVIDGLLENHIFQVPASMVESQIKHLIERQTNRMIQQGFSKEDLEKVLEKAKPEVQKQAEKDVRLAYILNAIAAAESIDATETEITTKIDDIVARSENKDKVSLEKALKSKFQDQIRSEIRESKLFTWLIDHAKIKDI
ncbi:MAG: Trigger factor [Elusimicrobia bacterium]|nr:Trigger factor [Elusimicrobiota bacterium]